MPSVTESLSKPTAAPERSLVQRMEALQRANDIRTRRAQLKRDLKAGRQPIDRLLLEPPDYLATAKVFDLLLAVPKYGRVKVNKILGQCKISPSKTVGGLSERQRRGLVALMRRGYTGRRRVTATGGEQSQGLRHHRPVRCRQGHADPRPARADARARAVGVGHDTRPPA